MKKLLSLLTLMIVAITASWANQTELISGITLPDVPSSTFDVAGEGVTRDDNGWYIMMSPKTNLTSSLTWYKGIGTNGGTSTFTIPTGTTAPYTSGSQSINRYTVQSGGRSHAIRFTGVETASFLGNYNSDSRKMHVSLFSYDGTAQTLVETKSVSSGIGELVFSDLTTSTVYIAYIYGNATSNSDFYGFALKVPTKTVATQEFAGVKQGDNTLTANTDYTVSESTITLSDDFAETTAPSDIKLINHITYTDNSTTDKDVAVTLEENAAGDYFEGTATIGLTTYTVKVPVEIPASAPTITTDIAAAYNVQKGKTQVLTIVAEDATSYQWYMDDEVIDGATSASYTYTAGSTIGATNEIYCKAINAAGSTNSTIATMTVTGSNACQLLQVQYSNNFYAFIKQPTDERPTDPYTITSYYLEGEDIPTIVSTGVTVSEGATWAVDGNTLTVTAEDETTTAEFTINAPVAVAPYTGLGAYTFTADDTWVKTGYAFDTASGKEGWKFAKNDESDGKLRNADGRTRIYLFVGPCKTITLTSGCSSDRNIRVFRNGTEVLSSTKLAKNGGTVSFNGDEDNAAMYEVRSAQTGGDGTIKIITVATTTEPVSIPEEGVATYVTKQALDFSTIDGTIKAYAVTNVGTTSATTAEVGQVPAGTPLLIKGTAGDYDVEVIASASAIENLLLASDGTVTGGDNIYAYSKTAKKFKKVASTVTIPAGKCYLQATGGTTLDIDFEGEATAINDVNANAEAVAPVKVLTAKGVQIGKFNVAGQQVK